MVVLPVPPFWERTAIVAAIGGLYAQPVATTATWSATRAADNNVYFSAPLSPSRARSKKARNPGGFGCPARSNRPTPLPEEARRFSPEKAYRPRVSPPSVEDRDACAIYASVRKDATPSREPVELALANLQKMLHRAGNVDGEGDGCGVLVDIPRKIWAEEVRAGGHNPALALDAAFAVGHVFVERSQDVEKALHDARELLGRGGFRILAERLGDVDSQALGPTAREEEPHFWQVGGLLARRQAAPSASASTCMLALESELGFHVASFSASTCVYKVMGAPSVLGEYYPDLRDERFETDRLLRPQPLLDEHLAVVQARAAVHRSSATTARSTRSSSSARRRGMLGVQIQPGSSDSQDLNRVDRPPDPGRGPVARRGDGDGRAADRQRDPLAARRPAPVLHVPARDDGAVRPGARGADRPPRRRVRVLGRRARPAPAVEDRDAATTTSSAPSPASSAATRWSPSRSRSRPARSSWSRSTASERASRLCEHWRDAARGRRALARAHRGAAEPRAAYDRALETGGPLEGTEIPGYTAAGPSEPVKVEDRVLAGFGWQRDDVKLCQQMASNGAEPIGSLGYDGPLAALSPERQNLADYFKETVAVVTNPAIDREREIEHFSTRAVFGRRPSLHVPGDRHADGRDLVPGDPRRPPRPRAARATPPTAGSPASTRPTCSRTSGRSSATARRRSTSRCSSPRPRTARSSGSSRRPSRPCARAPSSSCSPTAPSTTASAATSTRTWRPPRSTRR